MADVQDFESGATVVTEFIAIGKELAKLPILPKYTDCARDLYSISKRIMDANSNIISWLNKFLNFNFQKETAKSDFLAMVSDYITMKNSKERQQLKFNCGDIQNIYQRNLEQRMGKWFVKDQSKLLEAQKIFERLTDSDAQMVQFVEENIIRQLDEIVSKMEDAVDDNDLNKAEQIKIETKKALRKTSELIELFNHDLADLVVEFAKTSKTPITLND